MTLRNTLLACLFVAPALFGGTAQAGAEPAIDGYCPVAYVAADKAVKGDPKFKVKVDDDTYWFVNKDARKAFKKNPENFEVTYDGWCATGIAFGKKIKVDPTIYSVRDGRIFLFSNSDAKAMFDEDASLADKADAAWKTL